MSILTKTSTKTKRSCIYCNKQYTHLSYLEKHMLICNILYKSRHTLKIEEEQEELPSHKQICLIIKELVIKIKKIEEKVEIQDKYINKTKKKINIIDWLDMNIKPEIDYLDFISENIKINEEEIIFMMQNSFLDTLDKIISNNIENKSSLLPIFCFCQKQNILYVYQKNKWEELNKIDCIKMFNIIYSMIFKKLMEWKKSNEEQISKNETLEKIFIKTMGKILSVDFKIENILSKSKASFFNYLKTDMKQIVEYSFE